MAVIVLLFTFGTFVAMGLPIITAIFGLACGLSIVTLLGHVAQVPTVAPTLATMIGLGVGIDYALFIVTRHLEQRRDGMDTRESIARSAATSGGAVVFAGCTVMVALLSLAIVNIPLVTTLGYTSALVVAIAVTAAITLLPALLAIVGDRIDRLHLPLPGAKHDGKAHGWRRWAEIVARRPWPAAIIALVILGVLALPVLDLYLGQQDNTAMPKSTDSRQASDGMTAGFGAGSNGPLLLSVDMSKQPAKADQKQHRQDLERRVRPEVEGEAAGGPAGAADRRPSSRPRACRPTRPSSRRRRRSSRSCDKQLDEISKKADDQRKKAKQPATDPRLQDLRDDVKKTEGVHKVSQPLVNKDGTAAVITVTPTTQPSDRKTADLVDTLRDDTIPKATEGKNMTVEVGGQTAGYVDLASAIASKLVITIGVVVALSFLLLMLAFRSVVIPLTAGLMNLVSIGAAFGVVTAVFEKGWGASIVGLNGEVPIVSFVPLMMFAILFGLSMDYEVFLMTHIKEAWKRLGDNKAAVIDGVGTTGRVITSAALIMVSVFFAFILNGDPTVKQFGVGMGVAVAVDATVVRCLLVPAVMVLIGPANWWFPRWLDRLVPNFSIEGDEWFRERDEREAAASARRPSRRRPSSAELEGGAARTPGSRCRARDRALRGWRRPLE